MRPLRLHAFAAVSIATVLAAPIAKADSLNVVASIKPVHSLVATVMGELGSPHLLVSGADSPHTYSMRPSDAEALSKADVVFWVGEELETFLDRPIENLGTGATAVALLHAPGMTLLDYPEGAEDHDHEHEHEHADGDADHDEEHAAGDAGEEHHDEGEEHHHTGVDPHVWLDPANARAMVAEIVTVLSEKDPADAETYRRNGASLSAKLERLEADTAEALKPYRDVPYFTFHESFRYFDARFGLDGKGAISISPERQPGAQRLKEIRAEIEEHGRACIFAEPQFPPKLVDVIVEGTNARTGTLDPLGADLEPGPGLYPALIAFNRDAFSHCFQGTM